MKPARFTYLRPATLAEALEAKARHGDRARFLAGGQSLVPTLNFRMSQPDVLIDLNGVTELATFDLQTAGVSIGAMTRYRTMERTEALLNRYPLLADALPLIAHPQIRSRSTIGGNLAHADPASEMPAVLMALDARVVVASSRGNRHLAVGDFVTGPLTTALAADEIVTAVEIDAWPRATGMAFAEIARRRGDFAIAGVAVALCVEDGRCTKIRLALCGVADRAHLAPAAAACVGATLDDRTIDGLAATIAAALDPPGSLQASRDYQRHVAGVLCARTLRAAHARSLAAVEVA